MNIGEKYNKTNIHHQICIEKADYFSPLLCFFAFRLGVTNCELKKGKGGCLSVLYSELTSKKPRVLPIWSENIGVRFLAAEVDRVADFSENRH